MRKWNNIAFIISICTILFIPIAHAEKTTHTSVNQRNIQADDYLLALQRFEPWAESEWKDYSRMPGSGYFGDGASDGNGGIRGNNSIILSYTVLIRAFPDAQENHHRLERIESALEYSTKTHKSYPSNMVAVDGKKWGVDSLSSQREGWQTSLWSALMGFSAALIEKELNPELINDCKRVVAAEADFRSKFAPSSRYKRNTAAEENGWQSNILALAAAWMPEDPRANKWLKAAKLYLANTYTVPSDSTGPLRDWIKTQTLFPSYGTENHGFYHPTYQKDAGQSMGDSYQIAYMINPEVAKELQPFAEHNVLAVWQFLKRIILDSGEMAFPSGLDWSLHSYDQITYFAWLATHFNDPDAQWAEQKLSKQILYRQAINGDGRFVGESCRSGAGGESTDDFYAVAIMSSYIAEAYLHNEIAGFPKTEGIAPKNNITHYDDIGLIIQRSENALTTVSYGTKTMSLVYPLKGENVSQQFIISPNTSSFIGTDGETTFKDFITTQEGFRAEFDLKGTKTGRNSRMVIVSEPDVVVYIEIPSDTSKLTLKEWYLTAIENHALTGGQRKVIWKGNAVNIKERSGTLAGPINTEWVNIDNWIGFVAVQKGSFVYRAPSDYNREGAAEDALVFIPENTKSPRAVVVLPGKNSEITARVQKSLKWKTTPDSCKLYFKLPDGNKKEIIVPFK